MKTILIILDRNITGLPPALSILDSLTDYKIIMVSGDYSDEIDEAYSDRNIEFIHFYKYVYYTSRVKRGFQKLQRYFAFRRGVKKIIKANDYDLIWVLSSETVLKIADLLKGRKFILSIYELHDKKPSLLKKLGPIAKSAYKVLVPEYNRANIFKVWFNLKDTPIVVPNKPMKHPRERNVIINKAILDKFDKDKKTILYQGHISPDRDLLTICEAVEQMNGFQLVLMGQKSKYLDALMKSYKSITHIDFVRPPLHLNVTSHSFIGIVTYAHYSQNTIFCAPNKIWEYSGFGIPMLANDIPGLKFTVESNAAGICVDMNNKEQIINAINKIEQNYTFYADSSAKFYDSINICKIINEVIEESLD